MTAHQNFNPATEPPESETKNSRVLFRVFVTPFLNGNEKKYRNTLLHFLIRIQNHIIIN